jgi:predicted nucleic acid-binding protein
MWRRPVARKSASCTIQRWRASWLLLLVPVHVRLLTSAWELVEKHHIYKADALQIVSAKHANASEMYTGDEDLHRAAAAEGVRSIVLR